MFTIRIDASKDITRVINKLQKMEARVKNTHPAMQRVAEDMMRVTGVQFRSSGRRAGGSWARLNPKTVAKKGNTQILKTQGSNPGYSTIGRSSYENANTLFNSLVFRGAPFQILTIENRMVDYGTTRPGAGVHQIGSMGRAIPERPFLVFLPGDHAKWAKIISTHVVRPFMAFTWDSPQGGYFGSVHG